MSSQTPVKTPGPGTLVVTLYEARGLSLPKQHGNYISSQDPANPHNVQGPEFSPGRDSRGVPTTYGQVSGKYMPYALVDFDMVQILVNSLDGSPENPFWAGANTQYKFDVTRVAELTVHLYMRNPNATSDAGRTQDILLGTVRLHPQFDGKGLAGGLKSDKVDHDCGIEWVDIHHGMGKLHIGVDYTENQTGKLGIDDFELLRVLGGNRFSKVMQARKKDTDRIYALKSFTKRLARAEVAHVLAKQSVLAKVSNPFLVPLKFVFQSSERLNFIMAFAHGGELFSYLSDQGPFGIDRSRLYTAELICALEGLHGFSVVYRDLKPENILLDYQGHIALCDFGLCPLEMKDENDTDAGIDPDTFPDTLEYRAPELLIGHAGDQTVDWWTLGILLYEMLTGYTPFYDETTNEMYRKIMSEPLHFPGDSIVPPAAKDILTRLLSRSPIERLGANGSAEIKAHPFFNGIDWERMLNRDYEPSFKPNEVSCTYAGEFAP